MGPHVIRLTLRWVVFITIILFVVAFGGGIIGSSLIQPNIPIISTGRQPIRTVQEVTITPSKQVSDVVAEKNRSVVLLGKPGTSLAAGVVLTTDGVIASTETLQGTGLVATTNTGSEVPVTRIGTDALYGITYYKAENSSLPPFDLAGQDPLPGTSVIVLGRGEATAQPYVEFTHVQTFALPGATEGEGIQRIMHIDDASTLPGGTPLLQEDGALIGILSASNSAQSITVSDIRSSLGRITSGKREFNPLNALGIQVSRGFAQNPATGATQFEVRIHGILAGTPAARSSLAIGDVITGVNGHEITWERNAIEQFSADLPITLTALRDGEERTVTLQ